MNDGDEIAANTKPNVADTDNDGINDGDEVARRISSVFTPGPLERHAAQRARRAGHVRPDRV